MVKLKDEISPQLVEALADELARAWPEFPRRRFVAAATDGLEHLELLARVSHVARALGECLPGSFAEGAAILERALTSEGLTGWMTLACNEYVATHGIDDPIWPCRSWPGCPAGSPASSRSGPSSNAIRRSPSAICGGGSTTPTSTCAGSHGKAGAT